MNIKIVQKNYTLKSAYSFPLNKTKIVRMNDS